MHSGGGGASASESKRPNENPFGLVYQGALTENVTGKVNIRPVTYEVEGIEVAANLYLPADYDETSDKKYAAVTVAHPNGASKEQVAGLYAQRLAELGYIARYQGASGGTPRLRDYPSNRIEDVSGMKELEAQMSRAWINFARTGKPEAPGMPNWDAYTLQGGATMMFDADTKLVHHHDAELLKLLAPAQ